MIHRTETGPPFTSWPQHSDVRFHIHIPLPSTLPGRHHNAPEIICCVHDDDVHQKLLQDGSTLTFEQGLTKLRTAEATLMQVSSLRQSEAESIQQLKQSSKPDAKSKPCTPNHQQAPHLTDAGTVNPTRSSLEQTAQPAAKNADAKEN
ncbi:hypothetical protein OUZ56_011505 [Daphnia magna]|uniref:Uncharacterized protein n=1 Tax=Daphnia magna TaxID=35525 RepID=A0ABQ9Z0B8_9CRUS|nr:hypothetical protein OUZ56_011505 [Daphnia magna]